MGNNCRIRHQGARVRPHTEWGGVQGRLPPLKGLGRCPKHALYCIRKSFPKTSPKKKYEIGCYVKNSKNERNVKKFKI